MTVKLAIHCKPSSFSDKWTEYCLEHGVEHELVDCYDTDIINKLRGFDGLLWHFHHGSATDLLMACHVLTASEHMGLEVFPNLKTCWHYDDKIAQKYLFESIRAPLAKSYTFYDHQKAIEWLKTAQYPLVRKLRRGAGSRNVGLIRNFEEGRKYCKRAFGKGFSPVPTYLSDMSIKIRTSPGFSDLLAKIKRMPRILKRLNVSRNLMGREKGYVLFQDFAEGNTFDTRITIIGDRAWGFIRNVRKNDWRASGSHSINYDIEKVNMDCVKIAFETAKSLGSQCMAFDLVTGRDNRPMIVEMSYAFVPSAVQECAGHWDRELVWHEGKMWPEHAIIEDMLNKIQAD